jgi:hypothetical protein
VIDGSKALRKAIGAVFGEVPMELAEPAGDLPVGAVCYESRSSSAIGLAVAADALPRGNNSSRPAD